MKNHFFVGMVLGSLISFLTGCMTKPAYINEENPEASLQGINTSPVNYLRSNEFENQPPQCIAVLPLKYNSKNKGQAKSQKNPELTPEQLTGIRRILYSHVAPLPFRDVELSEIDKVVKNRSVTEEEYGEIATALDCDALLTGTITKYDTEFIGFYSKTSVGADLRLIRAEDNKVLWKGRHVATSHAGGLPITPVDVVVSVFHASTNIEDEQLIRVTDDLFRNLLTTWGDERQMMPSQAIVKQVKKQEPEPERGFFTVRSKQLVLRNGPGKSYRANSLLHKNDKLIVLDKKANSPWVIVKTVDGKKGYVYGKYITEQVGVDLSQEKAIATR